MDGKRIMEIRQHGKAAQGQKELLRHLGGLRVSLKQAIQGKCYDCTGYYADGRADCGMTHCPLYPFMAYNPNREKQAAKNPSPAHMEKMRAARRQKSNLLL